MDRDRTTQSGARAPGVEEEVPLVWRRSGGSGRPDAVREKRRAARDAKGGSKPGGTKGMPGVGLTGVLPGKAPSDRPAFQPYWGKPAVRNERGGGGNVGIIEARTAPPSYPTVGGLGEGRGPGSRSPRGHPASLGAHRAPTGRGGTPPALSPRVWTVNAKVQLILAMMHCSREPGYWKGRKKAGAGGAPRAS